jgi:predicted ArsR family transcriptional regulator
MDELDAVGDPDVRAAYLFARRSERPVTAGELAASAGIHRNVARSRLERLAAAGLLDVGYERRTGRTGPGSGRPAKTYAVAPELRAIQFPERHYEELLGLIVDALPQRGRAPRLRDTGAAYADELADDVGLEAKPTLRAGIDAVCAAMRRLGYQVSLEEVDEERAVIATPTCPLRPLVRRRPEAADLDRGMWAGLAARATSGVEVHDVRCETRDCLDDHASCRVVLELRPVSR